ncbi:MAG: histidinol-phosphate transaminase [Rikenellaceae bacterium]|jgi:histidinol-phosphate aminotransferase|nr:histidinol-phosphate transaminase [Rikenellaceae bacterium]
MSDKNKSVADLVRANIKNLAPYSTARDEYTGELGIYLDANENPYDTGVNRYPDPYQRELKARIAGLKGCRAEQVFIGNGSDEAIDLCYRVFCEPRVDNAVSIAPTYGMYSVAAAINDVAFRAVQLEADFSVNVEKLLAVTDGYTKLLWLCSPNNPTGRTIPREQIEKILKEFDGMVVLDEAYIDFSDDDGMLPLLDKYPKLIVLQTLSKAWGMAGLRLGLAFAAPEVIATFTRVKYPYNIGVATQRTVLERLAQDIDAQLDEIKVGRAEVARQLGALPMVQAVYPSDANFLLVKVDRPREIYDALIGRGIIVRDRSRIRGCEGCLRVTIGTPEENKNLIEAWLNL